ncbi:MAG: CHASE2 domain-containing protein [Candidatus Kapaibacteriota bacterium]
MRNVYSTASIFGLVALIYFSPGNIEIFDPIQNALADFSFTDIVYAQWRRDDAPVDENIILVNVGRNRGEIASQTKILAAMEPKVIGIDPLLSSEKEPEVDLALIDAIQSAKSVVMAARLSDWKDDNKNPLFLKLQPPHPKFQLPNVSYGHTSFTADEKNKNTAQTIRDFEPVYTVNDSLLTKKDTTISAFALEIAERWKPGTIKLIKERGEKKELINYRGSFNKFIQIDIEPGVSIDSAVAMYGSLVKGKIVLLGFMGQPFDNPSDMRNKFYTPAAKEYVGKNPPDMYAIVLHANIVSMLTRGELITQMPDWLGYAMAVIVCYINMALFHWITIKLPSFAGGEMKVIQLIQAAILVLGAMQALNVFDYQIKLSLTLAIILLSSDVMEIHESSVKRLIERIQDNRR